MEKASSPTSKKEKEKKTQKKKKGRNIKHLIPHDGCGSSQVREVHVGVTAECRQETRRGAVMRLHRKPDKGGRGLYHARHGIFELSKCKLGGTFPRKIALGE